MRIVAIEPLVPFGMPERVARRGWGEEAVGRDAPFNHKAGNLQLRRLPAVTFTLLLLGGQRRRLRTVSHFRRIGRRRLFEQSLNDLNFKGFEPRAVRFGRRIHDDDVGHELF